MTYSGSIFIISAASGAGKTSLVQSIVKQIINIELSISYTTRNKRPNEKHGIDYFFINQKIFLDMQLNGNFLETAKVFDNYYATSKLFVHNILAQGKDVILEIDWQGAEQIIKQTSNWNINNPNNHIPCKSVFILPPSLKVLSDRLMARGQDSMEIIQKRLNMAKKEIQHYVNYDYLIINDDFNNAVQDLMAIINTQRLAIARQQVVHASLINSLLV